MAKKEKQETQETEEKPSGNKKIIIFIVAGALLLVGVSVGITLVLLSGNDEASDTAEVEEEIPEKGDPIYYELKPFTVNLDPDDPVGFLQVQVQVLTYVDQVAADLEKHTPLIRNNMTVLFGRQKSAELRSPEGKQVLQKKIHDLIQEAVNKYGSGGEVDNVFFTNFVMQ